MSSLDFAVQNRDYEMEMLLLSRGAVESCREPATLSDEYPALRIANRANDTKSIKILLRAGCPTGAHSTLE